MTIISSKFIWSIQVRQIDVELISTRGYLYQWYLQLIRADFGSLNCGGSVIISYNFDALLIILLWEKINQWSVDSTHKKPAMESSNHFVYFIVNKLLSKHLSLQ